ncbi:MAG: thiosulfate sulfurtransferase [Alphaproteobacteria bacterium]|nr:thiosulfate sulfurtransferase [Alphaproteobacteria bacterium]
MTAKSIDPIRLKAALRDGGELAILDVREDGQFPLGHLLYAVPAPYSRFEAVVGRLIPRRSTRVVLVDAGDGVADKAARSLGRLGYDDVAVLTGGTPAWAAAGFVLFEGVNVPSKAFGELVEHECGTPSIAAEELKEWLDRGDELIVLDSRTFEEFQAHSLPTGMSCPGAELVYRVHDLVRSPDTTVVVNCAGRTRSIIGAQSLINAGLPNRVVAFRNGTMGWRLAGHAPEQGKSARAPAPSPAGLAKAKLAANGVARRFAVPRVDQVTLAAWQSDGVRTTYLFDVRDPEEFITGHLPESVSAPGGQLVQATDKWIATLGARVVLVDDTEVRATMTAHWLMQMGWDAHVLAGGLADQRLVTGKDVAPLAIEDAVEVMAPGDLRRALHAGRTCVVDVGSSHAFRAGHIAGAIWAPRAQLEGAIAKLPRGHAIVVTADDDTLSELAARDIEGLTASPVAMLAGGTSGWKRAGLPVETTPHVPAEADCIDHWFWEHERRRFVPQRMQEYLDWEIALPAQITADGDARFRVVVPR